MPPLKVPQDRGTGPQNADVYFAPLMWRVPVASLLNLFAVRPSPGVLRRLDLSFTISACRRVRLGRAQQAVWYRLLTELLRSTCRRF